jgi:Tol biopolymer transport system component
MSNTLTLAFGFDGRSTRCPPPAGPQRNRHRRLRRQQGEQRTHRREQRREWTRRIAGGKEVAFTYRGDVFVNSVEGGGTKRITTDARDRNGIEFGPDGKSLIYASERDGKWAI